MAYITSLWVYPDLRQCWTISFATGLSKMDVSTSWLAICVRIHPEKKNTAIEKQPFVDTSPIKNCWFSSDRHVSLPGECRISWKWSFRNSMINLQLSQHKQLHQTPYIYISYENHLPFLFIAHHFYHPHVTSRFFGQIDCFQRSQSSIHGWTRPMGAAKKCHWLCHRVNNHPHRLERNVRHHEFSWRDLMICVFGLRQIADFFLKQDEMMKA